MFAKVSRGVPRFQKVKIRCREVKIKQEKTKVIRTSLNVSTMLGVHVIFIKKSMRLNWPGSVCGPGFATSSRCGFISYYNLIVMLFQMLQPWYNSTPLPHVWEMWKDREERKLDRKETDETFRTLVRRKKQDLKLYELFFYMVQPHGIFQTPKHSFNDAI